MRRDLNDAVRTADGKISTLKIGGIVGQAIAAYLLLKHSESAIKTWDSLLVLFSVLVMPELLKSIIKGKYASLADYSREPMGMGRPRFWGTGRGLDDPDAPNSRR